MARSSDGVPMLCTSGFTDDVVFSHNGFMVRRQNTTIKENSRDFNEILLNDNNHQVLIASCAPAAKSALYDSLVSSELNVLRLVAATANWVASQRTTQSDHSKPS